MRRRKTKDYVELPILITLLSPQHRQSCINNTRRPKSSIALANLFYTN